MFVEKLKNIYRSREDDSITFGHKNDGIFSAGLN